MCAAASTACSCAVVAVLLLVAVVLLERGERGELLCSPELLCSAEPPSAPPSRRTLRTCTANFGVISA